MPTITYGANGRGQTSTVNASVGTNPVTATSYNASGQVTGVTFGSLDVAAFTFDNNTGRMTQYKETINASVMSGTIGWNSNGTPSSLATVDPFNASNGGKTCTFAYDDLTRITGTTCTGSIWSQTFSYDPFGNITKSGSLTWTPGYNSLTNRYTLGGTSYDANGNLLNDSFHTYSWDAENRPVTIDNPAINLILDAMGNIAEEQNAGINTEYIYHGNQKLALMTGQTLSKGFVPLPGGTQVKYNAGNAISTYRVPDWLGSLRIGSNPNRTYAWSVAFAPFGERYAAGGTPAFTFTGQTEDIATGLYDFLEREQHNGQGRWISPDPAGMIAVDLTDPQTWNRYAYVRNNPLIFVDVLGLWGAGSSPDPDPIATFYTQSKPDVPNPYILDNLYWRITHPPHRYRGPTISAYHPKPEFTISADHQGGAKAFACAGKAIWAGAKEMASAPDTGVANDAKDAIIDMGQKVAEYVQKNAPAIASAITTTFPSATKAFPQIAEGLGDFGKFGARAAVLASAGTAMYETGKSYKEQVDAGECGP